jgi:hypothetical protein
MNPGTPIFRDTGHSTKWPLSEDFACSGRTTCRGVSLLPCLLRRWGFSTGRSSRMKPWCVKQVISVQTSSGEEIPPQPPDLWTLWVLVCPYHLRPEVDISGDVNTVYPKVCRGWLSWTSFLETLTIRSGLPLCWDVITWCIFFCEPRDVFDDPLRGLSGYRCFWHFLHNPFKKNLKNPRTDTKLTLNPKWTLKILQETLKNPWKNRMKVYIVKYL